MRLEIAGFKLVLSVSDKPIGGRWRLINLFLISGIFCLGLTLFGLLFWQAKGQRPPFGKFFYVPARKSSTDAIQFGGLPVAICLMMIPAVVGHFYPLPILLQKLSSWLLLSQTVLIIYGYLDDKYEIRPVFKLFFQIFIVTTFSLVASAKIHPSFSSLAFIIMFIIGMGMLNGSNLLDGLDTLTIKFSSVQFLSLGLMPILFPTSMGPVLSLMSLMAAAAVWSFYPYNREPAKIHLGEIGGPSIGLFCFFLSTMFFAQQENGTSLTRASLAIIPLALPISELSISFLRRLYNKKGPFKGDKLHVHHILKNMHNLAPRHASSLMASVYLFTTACALSMAVWLAMPIIAAGFQFLGIMVFYLGIGKKYWSGSDTLEISAKSLFDYIRKKDVMLIETSIIDNFEITIMKKEDIEKIERDQQTQSNSIDDDISKAS